MQQQTIDGLNESILRDTEAAQVLERAAYRIENHGWTHGVEAESDDAMVEYWSRAAVRFCMRGAIFRALLDLGHTKLVYRACEDEPEVHDGTRDAASVRARAFGAMAHVILGQPADPMSNLPRIVSHYNDNHAVSGLSAAHKLRQGARHIRQRIADVKRGLDESRRQRRAALLAGEHRQGPEDD